MYGGKKKKKIKMTIVEKVKTEKFNLFWHMSKKKKTLPKDQVNNNQIDINDIGSLIKNEVIEKLKRPLYKLPVHKDLSRLASNYHVIDHENMIHNFNGSESGKNIKNLVLCLCSIIEHEKVIYLIFTFSLFPITYHF